MESNIKFNVSDQLVPYSEHCPLPKNMITSYVIYFYVTS